MRQRRLFSTFVAAALLMVPSLAQALTFTRVPGLDELSATAPLIVRGRVVAIEHDMIRPDDKHSEPVTAIHIQVLSGLKGARAGDVITVRQIGGPVTPDGRRWLHIGGIPRYAVGQEVLAFVDDRTHPFFGTAYADAGLFRIAADGDGRRLMLNARWQVLVDGPTGPAVDGTTCRATAMDPSRCTRSRAVDAEHDAGGPQPPSHAPVSVEAFEARILAHRGSTQAGPAQTVSASAQLFSQAVAALLRHDTETIRLLTGR